MVAIHNAVTNELETAKVTMIVQRDVPKYQQPFTVLFQAVNIAAAKNTRPVTAKVLLYLCSIVSYGNVIDRSASEIAKDLGYSCRNIEIALKELISNKDILKTLNLADNRRFLIVINPLPSWKGTVKERNITIENFLAADKNQLEIPFAELTSNKNKLESISDVYKKKILLRILKPANRNIYIYHRHYRLISFNTENY